MKFKKYLTEKQQRDIVTDKQVKEFVSKWRNKMQSKFGATFNFSIHFIKDRLNHPRNKIPISTEEMDFVLNGFLKKMGSQFKKDIEAVKNYRAKPRGKNKKQLNFNELEFVVSSRSTGISFVFVLKQDFHQKNTVVILPITIMRKKKFAVNKGEEVIVERKTIK